MPSLSLLSRLHFRWQSPLGCAAVLAAAAWRRVVQPLFKNHWSCANKSLR